MSACVMALLGAAKAAAMPVARVQDRMLDNRSGPVFPPMQWPHRRSIAGDARSIGKRPANFDKASVKDYSACMVTSATANGCGSDARSERLGLQI